MLTLGDGFLYNSRVELSLFFSWAMLFLLGIIATNMCNSCKASSDIFICLLLRLLSGWVWGPSGVWYYHLQTQNYPFLTQVEGKTTMYCHFSIIESPWLQRWHFLKAFSYFLFLKRLAVDFKSSNAFKGVFCLWVSTAFVPFCSFKKHFFINWYIEMIRHLSEQLCNISNSIE